MDLELILIILLPLMALWIMILDRKVGNRKAISTHHVLDKAFGRPQIVYREDGVGYDMDFSGSIKNCDAQTYDIPFVFRKKRIK